MAFDFKKEYKEFYMPKNKPEIVTVPKANYIAVRGKGKEHMKIPKEKTVRVTAIPVNTKEVILLEKRVLHRVHTIHTAILIHPGETIPMMFIL